MNINDMLILHWSGKWQSRAQKAHSWLTLLWDNAVLASSTAWQHQTAVFLYSRIRVTVVKIVSLGVITFKFLQLLYIWKLVCLD